ncbi:MAG: xanthine dehydrogenase family protein molybdopterin-binding subunit [Xanthobacteraceae bacterium]|nr:xanthine dehydrogenase family protein molybdopterin-binding subunit [Xanthobacteraceae bacterium]
MNYMPKIDRRSFLVSSAAAGLAVGMRLPFGDEAAAQTALPPEVNAWVVVKPDDTVIIRIARVDMGQGTLTGLAQLVAEELECDWSKVTWEYPSPGRNVARNRIWQNYQTAGSQGIRQSQQYVREGGAAARMMLIQAAANDWKVPAGECVAANSVITHKPSGRTTTFGKVADAAGKLDVPKNPPLKDAKDWKIAGKPLKRLDTPDKINGKQVYAIDTKLPGMLNAAIKLSPVIGGKVKSFDAAKVESMKGVKKVVQVGDYGAAVVADTWWHAKTALEALPIVWDDGGNGNVSSETIAARLKEGLDADEAYVGNKQGDAKGALASAAKKVEAVYAYPYQNHAPMEPMNTTALWTADGCQVWAPTQNAEAALAVAAAAAELPVGKCDVNRMHLGGGFGRRASSHDFVEQAVLIAKQLPGTPVKLIWSREEDMTHGRYHPITQCKLTGGFDAQGNLTALHMRLSGQSIVASLLPQLLKDGMDPFVFQGLNPSGAEGVFGYEIPNLLIDHAMRNTHITPGFWRGVNNNQNAIYLECFMDELAQAAGQDPLEFRRKLMANHPKHLGVLNAVAEKVGWGKPAEGGRFRGLAQHMGYGSYVAAAAEVSVDPKGQLKIHRIVAATNCGNAVNPQQIEAQIQGSFVYGLSALLYQECTVKNGKIEQENFDSYNVMRIDEMPLVETIIMPSGDFWGGVGEPTIFVAAPAVLNAIYAATGKRIRSFPLSKHDLKSA